MFPGSIRTATPETWQRQGAESRPRRIPTDEEAEAILLLVRTGWLKLELTLDDE